MFKWACLLVVMLWGTAMRTFAQPIVCHPIVYDTLQSRGYYFMLAGRMVKDDKMKPSYLLVLNGKGNIVYYKPMKGSGFALQPNGLMSYFSETKFYLMDSTFTVVDSVGCVNGVATDSHDFIALANGHYLLIGTEEEPADLSKYSIFMQKNLPGSAKGKLLFGVVQELDANKNLVYEWHSKPYFKVEDVSTVYPMDTTKLDVTHFNSIDIAPDGNFIISARYSNEVVKVNRADGSLIWRMGGPNNTLKLLGDSLPFLGQHDARYVAPNRISLFDNGYGWEAQQHPARAVEYEIDEKAKTITKVWSYTHTPKIISDAAGNAQRLPNGNTLITYGRVKHYKPNISFEEVTPAGEKVIEVSFPDTLGGYRVFHYNSLPFSIHQPVIKVGHKGKYVKLSTKNKYPAYQWSTGETSRSIVVSSTGPYSLFVPYGQGGFVGSYVQVTAGMFKNNRKKPIK